MLQHEPGPVTPSLEAFRPTSAPSHDNPGSLYLALAPNAGLRVGNSGSEGDGQVLLLVKLLASPLGPCYGACKYTVQGNLQVPTRWAMASWSSDCLLGHLTLEGCIQVFQSNILTKRQQLPCTWGPKMLWAEKGGMTGQGC